MVSSFFNEEGNIQNFWSQIKKLEKVLNIVEIVFVNNASYDNTLKILKTIEKKDSRVKVISNNSPSNYSQGFAKGIKIQILQYTLITHSDCQYNLDQAIRCWLEAIYRKNVILNKNDNTVFSIRLNRPIHLSINTFLNCSLTRFFLFQGRYIDFFSQPKIILTSLIKDYKVESGYLGYLFDLSLINHLKKVTENILKKLLPYIQVSYLPRIHGKSSLSENNFSYFLEVLDQIIFIIKEFQNMIKIFFINNRIKDNKDNFTEINNYFYGSKRQCDFIIENCEVANEYEVLPSGTSIEKCKKIAGDISFIYWPLIIYPKDFEELNKFLDKVNYSIYDLMFVEEKYGGNGIEFIFKENIKYIYFSSKSSFSKDRNLLYIPKV